MAQPTIWWLLAGVIVALELLIGTFYLLLIATGCAAAAVAAHWGAPPVLQFLVAAAVGGGAVVVWHLKRDRSNIELPAHANSNVNMDIGETVQIHSWNPDGTANVQYRGANWTVIHRTGVTPTLGSHQITEVIGNRLLVEKSSNASLG